MNTLFDTVVTQKLKSYKPYQELVQGILERKFPISLSGIHGSLLTFVCERLQLRVNRDMTLIFATEKEAEQFARDCDAVGLEYLFFPWWGVAPYHEIPGNSLVYGKRVRVLAELLSPRTKGTRLIITSVRALLGRLPDPALIRDSGFTIRVGQKLDPQTIGQALSEIGYSRVTKVSVHGEFAARGEVLDLFLPGQDLATRVVFEFENVEDIRRFDPLTQSSGEKIEALRVHAFRETIWNDEIIDRVRETLGTLPETRQQSEDARENLIDAISHGRQVGEEIWYPLGFSEWYSLCDYLGGDPVYFLVDYERLYSAAQGLEREFETSWRKARMENVLVPRPERLIWSLSDIQARMGSLVILPLLAETANTGHAMEAADDDEISYIGEHESALTDPEFHDNEGEKSGVRQKMPGVDALFSTSFSSEPGRSFFGNIAFLKEELAAALKASYQVFVFTESELQSTRIRHLLSDFPSVEVIACKVSAGFTLPKLGLMLIEEQEIFGRRKRAMHSLKKVQSEVLDTFVDLEPGDFVVHVNHGIGRFRGIRRINAGGTERDYIELEYADEEFIFVPIEQVNLVQRYIGSQGGEPRLDKIGGKSWERRKSLVRKSVEDIAAHLIDLYSRRKKARGFAFPGDNEWQIEFEARFPYEETEDQSRCIREVKDDMEKPLPMDRLVCGDVGYGKTEIALRAAFKAVSAGKQVAFLAPTTILVEQHFDTLVERVKNFPVRVGMLSRFVAPKEQKKALAQLSDGGLDIVVGTHRVLQSDIRFKDLGLIVIDEEQRFGVKDKEKLKELKHSVDCLTLTATPIPRTLHMSLLKIRDMSVLQTPPYNRRPIETHVHAFDDTVVADAIRREISRGGQVFYLHNRVESLENVILFLQRLVPEVLIESAHGQMTAMELEDIMHRFVHGGFHVLVATTIIENGINIPNVNTIIIDRADMYGISQLYQLRGRVGRSGRLAYAYLLYPGERALSELAMKRLQIISDFTELGSGFKIALKDLEVRGAGNLLGSEQSGEIGSVGFDLYLKLLDEAIRRLSREGEEEDNSEIYLDLEYSGFIPDAYIREASEKMEVYKKIASISTDEGLESVYGEILDRFGPMPEEVQSLLSLAEIRILARKLHIVSLRERKGVLDVEFGKVSHLNVTKVMELIRTSASSVRPDPHHPNVLLMNTSVIGLHEKSEFIRDRLQRLL